jgi:putative ABC transport system permease protein
VRAADRWYRAALRLYPEGFRQEFGGEMLDLFRLRLMRASRSGPATRGRLVVRVLADLVLSISRERFAARRVTPRRDGASRSEDIWRRSVTHLALDLEYALRQIRRAPVPAAIVIVLMATTIGAATAVFGIVKAVLLDPLPFADSERLVMVWEERPDRGVTRNVVGAHEYPAWKERARAFERLAAFTYSGGSYNLTGRGEAVALFGIRVSYEFFPALGVAPAVGRMFRPDEDQPERGQVAIVSHRLWRERFDGDPGIVGRTIVLNDRPYEVVGVMPAGFAFPAGPPGVTPDVWTPIAEPIRLYRGRHYLFVVGRLAHGVTHTAAQREMDSLARQLEAELPALNHGHRVLVRPLQDELVQDVRPALLFLLAAVALVLAIGCCNVANLLLARAADRRREMAIRLAIGATRGRLTRQLLTESLLLSAIGGAVGVLVSWWLVRAGRALAPVDVPGLERAGLDAGVLVFAAGVSILTGLLFGSAPMLRAAREELTGALRPAAIAGGQERRRAGGLLIVTEVALAFIMLAGAGLIVQSLLRLQRVEPGFRRAGILALDVSLPESRYADAARQRQFFDEVMGRVSALPGVRAAAAVNHVPLGGSASTIPLDVEGMPAPSPGEELSASYKVVSERYFDTLGIPIVRGRGFGGTDARVAVPLIRWFPQQPLPPRFSDSQPIPVAVVNETMARQVWAGRDPIGRRFRLLFSPWIAVVGVARDTRNASLASAVLPEFYLLDLQEPQRVMTVLVRAEADPLSLGPAVRDEVRGVDRDVPLASMRTLEDVVGASFDLRRFTSRLLGAFAAVSLLLMAAGIYGVIACSASARTHEIGVRMALGARAGEVLRLVVGEGLRLAVLGLGLGLAAALGLGRFIRGLLFDIEPTDPATLAGLAAVILGVAWLASYLPARRATRVDPLVVLRHE